MKKLSDQELWDVFVEALGVMPGKPKLRLEKKMAKRCVKAVDRILDAITLHETGSKKTELHWIPSDAEPTLFVFQPAKKWLEYVRAKYGDRVYDHCKQMVKSLNRKCKRRKKPYLYDFKVDPALIIKKALAKTRKK